MTVTEAALSDAGLAHKAEAHRRIKAEIKVLEADARKLADAVVRELARRNGMTPEEIEAVWSDDDELSKPARRKLVDLDAWGYHGLRVVVKAGSRTEWRPDDLRKLVSRAIFGRVTRTAVDNALMAAEIKAGRVVEDDVAAARDVTLNSPSIVVTGDAA